MKKILSILATAVATMALAASANAQISVHAGYNLINHTGKTITGNTTTKSDPSNLNGIYVGGTYDWEFLSKNWGTLSLQPGLTYSFAGKCLYKEESGDYKSKESRRDHYLDMPVNVKYSYDLIPGKLIVNGFAGPVFSFGLASYVINRTEDGDDWIKSKSNLYNGRYSIKSSNKDLNEKGKDDDSNLSMFDLKFGIGLGVTILEKYNVKVGYNIGLLNRTASIKSDVTGDKYVSRTNVFQIGFGYNF